MTPRRRRRCIARWISCWRTVSSTSSRRSTPSSPATIPAAAQHAVPFLICDRCQSAMELEDARSSSRWSARASAGLHCRRRRHWKCTACARGARRPVAVSRVRGSDVSRDRSQHGTVIATYVAPTTCSAVAPLLADRQIRRRREQAPARYRRTTSRCSRRVSRSPGHPATHRRIRRSGVKAGSVRTACPGSAGRIACQPVQPSAALLRAR